MLIAKTEPLMVFYHDGFLRFSVNEYDGDSKEMTSHITNTQIAKKLFY